MYDHIRAVGMHASIYFILLVITGNIIMLNLFLAILLGNFDRARNSGGKKKIFDAFDQLQKQGYELNIAITYLFDDADFSRYIEEKILSVKDERDYQREERLRQEQAERDGIELLVEPDTQRKDSQDNSKEESVDDFGKMSAYSGDDPEDELSEFQIRQVFIACTSGTLEMILTGEKTLNDTQEEEGAIDDDGSVIMSEVQRKKTIEILTYIKRQQRRRAEAVEFQAQMKKSIKAQQEAIERAAE